MNSAEQSRRWRAANPEKARAIAERGKAKAAEWRSANPDRVRAIRRRYLLKQKYGLTPEQVDAKLVEQDGLCAICREEPATDVDHDHATGEFRGICCPDCNLGLGRFHDDIGRLEAAIEYLRKGGEPMHST